MRNIAAKTLFAIAIMLPLAAVAQQATSQVARRPEVKESPQPFPDAALKAGHSGTVIVSGVLGRDAVFHPTKIKVSSGSDILDSAAMEATPHWTFTPAYDAAGNAIEVPMNVEVEYTKAFESDYPCRQFVLDSDWHDRTRGRDKRAELRIYATLRGFHAVLEMRSGNVSKDFDAVWDRLVDYCRGHADQRFRAASARIVGV